MKLLIRISFGLVILSIILKILHIPVPFNLFMNIGFVGIIILYLIQLITSPQRQFLDWVTTILAVSWALNAILTINHILYKSPFYYITILLLPIWLVWKGYIIFFKKE